MYLLDIFKWIRPIDTGFCHVGTFKRKGADYLEFDNDKNGNAEREFLSFKLEKKRSKISRWIEIKRFRKGQNDIV